MKDHDYRTYQPYESSNNPVQVWRIKPAGIWRFWAKVGLSRQDMVLFWVIMFTLSLNGWWVHNQTIVGLVMATLALLAVHFWGRVPRSLNPRSATHMAARIDGEVYWLNNSRALYRPVYPPREGFDSVVGLLLAHRVDEVMAKDATGHGLYMTREAAARSMLWVPEEEDSILHRAIAEMCKGGSSS